MISYACCGHESGFLFIDAFAPLSPEVSQIHRTILNYQKSKQSHRECGQAAVGEFSDTSDHSAHGSAPGAAKRTAGSPSNSAIIVKEAGASFVSGAHRDHFAYH